MLVNGKGNSLAHQIVMIVDKERKFAEEQQALVEKFESAENCGNTDEMQKLGLKGMELERKIRTFLLMKITVMTMIESRNPDFCWN